MFMFVIKQKTKIHVSFTIVDISGKSAVLHYPLQEFHKE